MYSTTRFKNATKCSEFRMLPGTASVKHNESIVSLFSISIDYELIISKLLRRQQQFDFHKTYKSTFLLMIAWQYNSKKNNQIPSNISEGRTGFTRAISVSRALLASRRPSTSLSYSRFNFLLSLSFILQSSNEQVAN